MKLAFLNSADFIFFRTRDFAVSQGLSISAATEQLKRFANKGLVCKLSRGLWANANHPYFDPIYAVNYLLGNEQGYVSFLTALSYHGLISQIPQMIQIASTGRSRKLLTPIANYEIIQLGSTLFYDGLVFQEGQGGLSYQLASPEKALLDTLYISTRRAKRFDSLPELDLSHNFSEQSFLDLLDFCVEDKRIKSAVLKSYRDSK